MTSALVAAGSKYGSVDHDVRRVFLDAVERFAQLGCEPVECRVPSTDLFTLWGRIAGPECFASEGPLLARWAAEMTPGTAEMIEAGGAFSAGEYLNAQRERARLQRDWELFLSDFDILLTPVAEVPAFGIDDGRRPPSTGSPAASPGSRSGRSLHCYPT